MRHPAGAMESILKTVLVVAHLEAAGSSGLGWSCQQGAPCGVRERRSQGTDRLRRRLQKPTSRPKSMQLLNNFVLGLSRVCAVAGWLCLGAPRYTVSKPPIHRTRNKPLPSKLCPSQWRTLGLRLPSHNRWTSLRPPLRRCCSPQFQPRLPSHQWWHPQSCGSVWQLAPRERSVKLAPGRL